MEQRKIEIMDTTLRDGEQTSGVSFSVSEKLTIAKLLLEELKVDRIEIASARVSDGEMRAVQKITEWASQNNFLDNYDNFISILIDATNNFDKEKIETIYEILKKIIKFKIAYLGTLFF
jgi:isopropylmalate/homocitrate/citramalate synthase